MYLQRAAWTEVRIGQFPAVRGKAPKPRRPGRETETIRGNKAAAEASAAKQRLTGPASPLRRFVRRGNVAVIVRRAGSSG